MIGALNSVALRAKHNQQRVELAQNEELHRAIPAGMEDAALADALGEPYDGIRYSAADLAEVQARIIGKRGALAALEAKIASAEAAEAQIVADRRTADSLHVRQTIVPPLLAAAKEAGAAFSRAMAELAAAEDLSLQLQRRPGQPYVTGAAGSLLTTMGTAATIGTFCDAGSARGAYDWPGYTETSRRIEDELRELHA